MILNGIYDILSILMHEHESVQPMSRHQLVVGEHRRRHLLQLRRHRIARLVQALLLGRTVRASSATFGARLVEQVKVFGGGPAGDA